MVAVVLLRSSSPFDAYSILSPKRGFLIGSAASQATE